MEVLRQATDMERNGPMQMDRSDSARGDTVPREPRSITNLRESDRSIADRSSTMAPKKRSNKHKQGRKPAAKRQAKKAPKMTPEVIQHNTRMYSEMFPNWTTSINAHAAHKVDQAAWDGHFEEQPAGPKEYKATELTTAKVEQRRAAVPEQGKALGRILTYEIVEDLKANGLLTPALAREWGAYVEHVGGTVPFNMVAKGLEKVSGARDDEGNLVNPPIPPKPRTDAEHVLGLVFPGQPSVMHFKSWYESKPGCNFEQDLKMPMLEAYRQYCVEYPGVRHYPLGRKSAIGRTPSPERAFARKHPPEKYDTNAPWPDVDLTFPGDGEAPSDTSDDEDAPAYTTESGVPLLYVPSSWDKSDVSDDTAELAAALAAAKDPPPESVVARLPSNANEGEVPEGDASVARRPPEETRRPREDTRHATGLRPRKGTAYKSAIEAMVSPEGKGPQRRSSSLYYDADDSILALLAAHGSDSENDSKGGRGGSADDAANGSGGDDDDSSSGSSSDDSDKEAAGSD